MSRQEWISQESQQLCIASLAHEVNEGLEPARCGGEMRGAVPVLPDRRRINPLLHHQLDEVQVTLLVKQTSQFELELILNVHDSNSKYTVHTRGNGKVGWNSLPVPLALLSWRSTLGPLARVDRTYTGRDAHPT